MKIDNSSNEIIFRICRLFGGRVYWLTSDAFADGVLSIYRIIFPNAANGPVSIDAILSIAKYYHEDLNAALAKARSFKRRSDDANT